VVSALIATAFAQETPEAASRQWRWVADQLRPKLPKLAVLMDEAEADVLAYMDFPSAGTTTISSPPSPENHHEPSSDSPASAQDEAGGA
jgi:hypothetical protein